MPATSSVTARPLSAIFSTIYRMRTCSSKGGTGNTHVATSSWLTLYIPAVVLAFRSIWSRVPREFQTAMKNRRSIPLQRRTRINVSGNATRPGWSHTIAPSPTKWMEPFPRDTRISFFRMRNGSASDALQAPILNSLRSMRPSRSDVNLRIGIPCSADLTDRPFTSRSDRT